MKDTDLKVLFIIVFCLSSVLFFSPSRVNETKTIYTYYALFSVVVVLIAINFRRPDHNLFNFPVVLLLIASLISGFSATIFWNQSLFDSMKAIIFFLSYSLFFLLIFWKFRVEDIEKLIIILGIIYIIVDTLAFLYYPRTIFGGIRWGDNRGFPRISISGTGFLYLFSFYSLGKYFQKLKLWWLLMFFVTLIFIILVLSRTLIAISFIFLAMYAFHKSKKIYKIVAVLIISSVFFIISQMSFFKILSDQTVSQTNNIENDIRIKSADFYLFHFSPNIFTKIFGNGVPDMGSSYGRYIWKIQTFGGLYSSDIGYLGLYIQFGVLALFAYVIIILRTIKVPVPDEYLYCKYFLYFVFSISIIVSSSFSTDFIIPILLALYVVSKENLKQPVFLEKT